MYVELVIHLSLNIMVRYAQGAWEVLEERRRHGHVLLLQFLPLLVLGVGRACLGLPGRPLGSGLYPNRGRLLLQILCLGEQIQVALF